MTTLLDRYCEDGKQEYCTSKNRLKSKHHYANFDGKISILWELYPEKVDSVHFQDSVKCDQHRLVIVVDTSLSTDDKFPEQLTKFERTKVFLQLLVGVMKPCDYLCIVAYNTRATVCYKLCKLTNDNKEKLALAIDKLKPEGLANIESALMLAADQFKTDFKKSHFYDDRILFLCNSACLSSPRTKHAPSDPMKLNERFAEKVDHIRKECSYSEDYRISVDVVVSECGCNEQLSDLCAAFSPRRFVNMKSFYKAPANHEETMVDARRYVDEDTMCMELGLVRSVVARGLYQESRTAQITGHSKVMIKVPGQENLVMATVVGGNMVELEVDAYDKQSLKKLAKDGDTKIEIDIEYRNNNQEPDLMKDDILIESLPNKLKYIVLRGDPSSLSFMFKRKLCKFTSKSFSTASKILKKLDRVGVKVHLKKTCESLHQQMDNFKTEILTVCKKNKKFTNKEHFDEDYFNEIEYFKDCIINTIEDKIFLIDIKTLSWDHLWLELISMESGFLKCWPVKINDDRISFEEIQLNDELFEICYDLKSIYSSVGLPMDEIDSSQNLLLKTIEEVEENAY